MHQRRVNPPMIVFNVRGKIRIYSLNFSKNPWLWKSPLSAKDLTIISLKHKLGEAPNHTVVFSCDGLLLVQSGSKTGTEYAICNPVTREETAFSLEADDIITGFFFHPLDKEYKLLIARRNTSDNAVFGLSTRDRRHLRGIPRFVIDQEITGTALTDACLKDNAGVAACGALFWNVIGSTQVNGLTVKVEEMSMFDLETENFIRMPQPTDRYKRELRTQTRLLEVQGKLWCCDVYTMSVDVWILEDIKSWRWVKRYVVNLDQYINKGGDQGKGDAKTTVLGIQDGRDLVLSRSYVGLLWCNLRLNTVRKMEKVPDITNIPYTCSISGVQYTSSLVRLQKFNILPDT